MGYLRSEAWGTFGVSRTHPLSLGAQGIRIVGVAPLPVGHK